MQGTIDDLKEIKELVASRLNHSFIKNIIPKPLIDEDKLTILYFLSSKYRQEKDDICGQVTAIMLMQTALDTHEQIPNKNDLPLNLVEKQMTVLVGDYYSSLYYYVLANVNQVDLIQQIALATKRINEHKVNLYNGKLNTLDQIYSTLVTIESELFTSFSKYTEQQYLEPIIQHLFLYNRLLNEKNLILKDEPSIVNKNLRKMPSFDNKTSILNSLNEKISECVYVIEESLPLLTYEDHLLKRYINKRLALFNKSYIAEEG